MQHADGQINRWAAALLALAIGGAATWCAIAPWLGAGDGPAQWADGRSEAAARERLRWAALAAVAAVAVLRPRLDLLARCAAGTVAGIATAWCAFATALSPWWALPCTAAAWLAAPLLRERGLPSLLWVPTLAVLPALALFRTGNQVASAVAPFAQLAATVPAAGPLLLLTDDDAPAEVLWQAACRLRRPFHRGDVDLFAVRNEADLQLLARLGMPVVTWRGGRAQFALLERPPAQGALPEGRCRILLQQHGGALHLAVHAPELAGGELWLLGPTGAGRHRLDDGGGFELRLADDPLTADWLRPLPWAPRIRVVVLSPAAAETYGLRDLVLDPTP